MDYRITEQNANRILEYLGYEDYMVIDIYEDSFRCIRNNEFILSELNVELSAPPILIDNHNVWAVVSFTTHVLKRFK